MKRTPQEEINYLREQIDLALTEMERSGIDGSDNERFVYAYIILSNVIKETAKGFSIFDGSNNVPRDT